MKECSPRPNDVIVANQKARIISHRDRNRLNRRAIEHLTRFSFCVPPSPQKKQLKLKLAERQPLSGATANTENAPLPLQSIVERYVKAYPSTIHFHGDPAGRCPVATTSAQSQLSGSGRNGQRPPAAVATAARRIVTTAAIVTAVKKCGDGAATAAEKHCHASPSAASAPAAATNPRSARGRAASNTQPFDTAECVDVIASVASSSRNISRLGSQPTGVGP